MLFSLGMFVSLFCLLATFRIGGDKLLQRLKISDKLKFNWSLVNYPISYLKTSLLRIKITFYVKMNANFKAFSLG